MLSIGDFARIGRVSVRMLRHYDALGLLAPAAVDPFSGYRSYAPDQLARLHRIVSLKDLGFTLDQIGRVLAGGLSPAELQGMLVLRRAQIAEEHELAAARLVEVEHRLRIIEKETVMSDIDYVLNPLPEVRLLARTAHSPDRLGLGSVVEPLFVGVMDVLEHAPGTLETPIASYDTSGEGIAVTAGYAYDGPERPGAEIITLPAAEQGACGVHRGPMDGIGRSWQSLHLWLTEQGWTPSGPGRELYVVAEPVDDQSGWVVELQQPVTRATGPQDSSSGAATAG